MKNTGGHIALATADKRAPGVRSGDAASEATLDIADAHQLNLARALRLGQLLRVPVRERAHAGEDLAPGRHRRAV